MQELPVWQLPVSMPQVMTNNETRYTFDSVVRMVLTAVSLVAFFFLLRYLSDVLLPFVAAVVLAYLLNPLVTLFEKRTKRRSVAVGLTLGGLGLVGLAVMMVIVPLMIGQVRHFGSAIDKLRDDLVTSASVSVEPQGTPMRQEGEQSVDTPVALNSSVGWNELKQGWAQYRAEAGQLSRSERMSHLRETVAGTYLGDLLNRVIRYAETDEFDRLLVDAAKRLAVGGWSVVSFAVNVILGLTGLIVVILYLVFLLLDYPSYARAWTTFLPPDYRGAIVDFGAQFEIAMRRYFRGQSVVALLVGTMFALGFTIIGLPMAVPLGLFVGMLNMVPYLQTVGLVPAVLLAGLGAVEGETSFLLSVAMVIAVFAVVQIIQDALITPRIMGKATGLRPVSILLGVFIWGKLLGFMGLLLAIPLTCIGIAYYRRFVLRHELN
jgi:predicted PurR-regulated permease PerM